MYIGLHALAAQVTQNPELSVTQEEGDAFMLAAQNYMRHHPVAVTQQTIDLIAFIGTAGAIYGPRLAMIVHRKRQERQAAPSDNVFPFGQPIAGE